MVVTVANGAGVPARRRPGSPAGAKRRMGPAAFEKGLALFATVTTKSRGAMPPRADPRFCGEATRCSARAKRGLMRAGPVNERKRVQSDRLHQVERRAPATRVAGGWGSAMSLPAFGETRIGLTRFMRQFRILPGPRVASPRNGRIASGSRPLGDSPTANRGGARGAGMDTSVDGRNAPASECRRRPLPRVTNAPSGGVRRASAMSPPGGCRGPLTGRRQPPWTGYTRSLREHGSVVSLRVPVLQSPRVRNHGRHTRVGADGHTAVALGDH